MWCNVGLCDVSGHSNNINNSAYCQNTNGLILSIQTKVMHDTSQISSNYTNIKTYNDDIEVNGIKVQALKGEGNGMKNNAQYMLKNKRTKRTA